MRTSGQNDQDVIDTAHTIYESDKGSRFLSERSWKQLMKYPKWRNIIMDSIDQPRGRPRKMSSQSSDSSSKRSRDEFDGGDTPTSVGIERPMGCKKTKALAKGKGKGLSIDLMETFNCFNERLQMNTDGRIATQELEREQQNITKKRLALAEWKNNWDALTRLR